MMPRGEADVDIVPYVDEDGKGVYRMLEGFVTLTVGGGQAEKLEIICPSIAATGENITLAVRAVDREGYLSGGCRASFEVLPVDGLILPENGFTFSSEDRGVKTITARVTVPGTFRVAVRGLAPGDVFISNPINVSEIPGGRIYWGDLHQHSALGKDANRSPEWVFENNKRRDRMDFAAVSVHDIFDYYCLPLTAQEWDYLCGVADRYNMEGGFVTLRSFEWTDLPRGHRNVYYAPGEASPVVSYEAAAGPVALEEKLEGHRCLVIPHHTAWRLMYSGKGYEWGRVGWGQQRLVEIYSKHGSSDYHAGPLPIHRDVTHWFIRLFGGTNRAWDGSGSYVREALAQGYRLGITAGGDSHWARGGSAFGTGLIEDYPRGLQAVCADNLTRGSLFDAMWQRRTYATTGARIIVGFEVNGAPMGSEIAHGGKPVAISFTVNGTGPVTNVEVWKYSADGWQPFNFPGGGKLDLAGSFCDYAASGDSLYFLRVVQQDGNIAWSSPIWVSGR
jgi:hypothetical protein